MYDFTAKLKKNLSNNVSVEVIFFHIYGRSKLTCGRRKINIPECDRTKMYRTFNTEFYQVHTIERLQSIYRQS